MNNTSKNDKDFLPYLEATMLALKARQREKKILQFLKTKTQSSKLHLLSNQQSKSSLVVTLKL